MVPGGGQQPLSPNWKRRSSAATTCWRTEHPKSVTPPNYGFIRHRAETFRHQKRIRSLDAVVLFWLCAVNSPRPGMEIIGRVSDFGLRWVGGVQMTGGKQDYSLASFTSIQ